MNHQGSGLRSQDNHLREAASTVDTDDQHPGRVSVVLVDDPQRIAQRVEQVLVVDVVLARAVGDVHVGRLENLVCHGSRRLPILCTTTSPIERTSALALGGGDLGGARVRRQAYLLSPGARHHVEVPALVLDRPDEHPQRDDAGTGGHEGDPAGSVRHAATAPRSPLGSRRRPPSHHRPRRGPTPGADLLDDGGFTTSVRRVGPRPVHHRLDVAVLVPGHALRLQELDDEPVGVVSVGSELEHVRPSSRRAVEPHDAHPR